VEAAASRAHVAEHSIQVHDIEQLTDFCWRPGCRKEFRRAVGPGRRQAYCSEICRRKAEKELRQARARLVHYEAVVKRLRIDVAAYAKPDVSEAGDEMPSLAPDTREATAENAVRRAAGTLIFANPDDPAVQELQMLYNAVAPIILPD
jgi:hypothetical protein